MSNRLNIRFCSSYIIVKISKVKDKEKILKIARHKYEVTHKRYSLRLSKDLISRNLTNQEVLGCHSTFGQRKFQSMTQQNYNSNLKEK